MTNFNFFFFMIIFFHFSDLRNWVKWMDSMVPCYYLLNMKAIWLYMVSAPPPTTMMGGEGGGGGSYLIWKFAKILWWQNFFLHLWQDKPLWVELKTNGGVIFITILLHYHFFRKSQHPEKWSVSFKNFFRKCECISCYLPISSNLQFQF